MSNNTFSNPCCFLSLNLIKQCRRYSSRSLRVTTGVAHLDWSAPATAATTPRLPSFLGQRRFRLLIGVSRAKLSILYYHKFAFLISGVFEKMLHAVWSWKTLWSELSSPDQVQIKLFLLTMKPLPVIRGLRLILIPQKGDSREQCSIFSPIQQSNWFCLKMYSLHCSREV